MSSDNKKSILKLVISEKLEKDLNDIAKRYDRDINELVIQALEEYVISKNTKLYSKEEWDRLVNDLDKFWADEKPKEEKPRNLTSEEINELLSNDEFWNG